ncbi:RNA polymerase subunit sigma-70 [Allorhizocola rhizosphaerae]|uniref:RNA polymerase subunit sigma-70 n=1 Tax=Allorhizocola rhizosphaerae TaxID=1872709 RepID=UPI001FECD44C|nr:RNA polymerase subunit sigma-70 [Allorhizocola rhizosphaerae]
MHDDPALLTAARAGDHDAFVALLAPHLRALHVHCYRMLGSLDDADDALQEAQLLAWRGLKGYEGRAPLRHWLYRIATTTCLKVIRARGRTPLPAGELFYLQPYPDRLLDQLIAGDPDPAAAAEQRDSVALAFIVALQQLPATQRAALLLRDVLAFTPAETAELLDTSIAAANSLLQRSRATLTAATGRSRRPLDATDRQIVRRFVEAWHRRDIAGLAALLREDAILRMPPEPGEFTGRDVIVEFFATVPAEGRLDLIRLVETGANGQPALAAYLPDDVDLCQGYGIMVLDIADGLITTITGFPNAALFPAFALPTDRCRTPETPLAPARRPPHVPA